MKWTMQNSISVGAGATNENILATERFARPVVDSIGDLYVTGSALGLTAELNVAGQSVTPPTGVNAQNRFPVVPDDLLCQDFEAPVDKQIQLRVVNTTGGALTVFWRIDLEDAERVE